VRSPREIAHEAMYAGLRAAIPEVGGPTVNLIALGVRAGMIEALRWVLVTGYSRSVADTLLIEAKLAELEGAK